LLGIKANIASGWYVKIVTNKTLQLVVVVFVTAIVWLHVTRLAAEVGAHMPESCRGEASGCRHHRNR
jgi:hypothetical protein